MSQPNSGLMIQRTGDVYVVEFLDSSILDQANIDKIQVELTQLVDKAGHPKLIISFAGVSFISSAVLGVLLSVQKRVKKAGGEMRLSHIGPKIGEVFKITQIDKIVKTYRTTEDALIKF